MRRLPTATMRPEGWMVSPPHHHWRLQRRDVSERRIGDFRQELTLPLSLGESHGRKFPHWHCAATEAEWRRGAARCKGWRPLEAVAEAGGEAGGGERQGGEASTSSTSERQGGERGEEVVAWGWSTEAKQRHWRPATSLTHLKIC